MPFTIPNEAQAGNANQAEWDKVDIDALVLGVQRIGVVGGCAVTAQGSPDMTVAVAAGSVSVNRKVVAVAAGNVTITTADGSNPRFDLIVVNDSGTKSAVAGTAASNPVFPAIPSNSVLLAAVYVPASDTAIESGQITDKRVDVRGPFTIRKTASETVNNSATLQNDDHLFWAVSADEVWFFQLFLRVTGVSINADFQIALTYPTGTTISWGPVAGATAGSWESFVTGGNPPLEGTEGSTLTAGLRSGTVLMQYQGIVRVSSTAGTLQVQWAQNSATAENVTVEPHSFLRLERLSA